MTITVQLPTDVSIITTYRCNMKCRMCNIWKNPSEIGKEIKAKELEILPQLKIINITGGEPFVRNDLDEIIEVSFKKSPRVVISTAGHHVDDILSLAEKFPKIGIRVSLEGFSTINDYMRGRDGGFDRGMRTLLGLREMGVKDIGFAMTVSHNNAIDLLPLYEMAKNLNMDFATASFHNSTYFHKFDNLVENKDEVVDRFFDLADRLLKEKNPKSWFRAFFNVGLINYIVGNKRLLPCEAGTANFFIDPYGEAYPCNGLEDKYWNESMGNIRDVKTFDELWYSEKADKVRALVRDCPKNCWMVGTAAPVMKKYLKHPAKWVLKNKLNSLQGKLINRTSLPKQFDVGQSHLQGDLRIDQDAFELIEILEEYPVKNDQRFMTWVVDVDMLTDDAFILKLERNGFQFIPGQNVSIGPHMSYHLGRDYTFYSGINDEHLEFLIREVKNGKITPFLKNQKKGDKVDIVGPYGDFVIDAANYNNQKYLFIASGVGIGPFHSFIKSYSGLNYAIIHGVREVADLIIAKDFNKDRYVSCVSGEMTGNFNGRVTSYLKDYNIDPETNCYICGNPYMLREVYKLLVKKGLNEGQIYMEAYYAY